MSKHNDCVYIPYKDCALFPQSGGHILSDTDIIQQLLLRGLLEF